MMIRSLRVGLCVMSGVFAAMISGSDWARASEPLPFQVGTAKIEITPSYPIRLAGYSSRKHEVDRVAQPIFVRAIAIRDNSASITALCLNVETCGFPADLVEDVCARIGKQTGLPRECIAVCSTHTHSAPWVLGYAPFISNDLLPPDHIEHMKRFRTELEAKLVDAGTAAVRNLTPARLEWGRGKVGFAANRRVLQDGHWKGFGVQPDGPTDHRLPVLVAKNAEGKPIAILMEYACHCTTLGGNYMEIAGDWAGFAQAMVEEDFPGATAMVIIGCGADANPEPRGQFEYCRQHGTAVRKEVQRLVATELKPVQGPLRCRFDVIDLPLGEIPERAWWEKEAAQGGARGHWAQHFLEILEAGKPIPNQVKYPIGTWCFGDSFAMVFLGGEVVVDYAIRMDREFDSDRIWVVSYANDVPCYIPSKRILREGGYEADYSMVYYGKPTRFAPEVEDRIIDAVQRLLPHDYYSKEKQRELPPARDPQASLKAIHVPPDVRVELVASEPLIVDPVAFDWGPDGSLWVVEMRDYPNGMDGRGKPGGRIKRLFDRDGDGRYDEAALFVDGLVYPTGVKVWRDGILVTAAPEILFFSDRDGDGRAEFKEVLYRGFGEGNQQHRVNGLRFGIDNWLYVGNGESGGEIESVKTGKRVAVRGRDLRIRPDNGDMETQPGQTQYGRCEDDWGNWFGGNNSLPMWHYVLEDRYLGRNPHLRVGGLWRQVCDPPGAAPVFPKSRTLTRFNDFDKVDRFTSACSPEIYRDRWLGPEYEGNVFICEPVHNLVYRGVMEPLGYSFRVHRPAGHEREDFFASEDNWTRPVMVRCGPDGALWVADMYRFVIEHPEWIPQTWQRKLDVRAGEDRGRIYRVVPVDREARPIPKLAAQTPSEWAAALASPNAWVRGMAQQLLLWRGEASDVRDSLVAMLRGHQFPQARLHALYTLDGLSALGRDELTTALADPHPAVVRHALRLAEPLLSKDSELATRICQLDDRGDPQLQVQLAYTLGAIREDVAARRLGDMLASYGSDVWFRRAGLSSLRSDNIASVVASALKHDLQLDRSLMFDLFEQAAAFGNREAANQLASAIVLQKRPMVEQFRDAARLMDIMARARQSPESLCEPRTRARLSRLVQQATEAVRDEGARLDERTVAIALLGRDAQRRREHIELLSGLLRPQIPQELQRAAVERLAALGDPAAPRLMLNAWRSLSPQVRDEVLDALFGRAGWIAVLLEALQRGDVRPADLGAARVSMLLNSRDAEIRRKATSLLGRPSSERQEVVKRYLMELEDVTGDVARGKEVFRKRCATCHQLEGVGESVGADLLALTDRSLPALLTAILDPNRALEDRFQSYTILLTDGRVLSGMLLAESGNSVTVIEPDAKKHVILRSEIEEMISSGKSLMPEGLEKDLAVQDLADVTAYLQSFRPAPKQFAGNEPQPAPVRDDGSIRLFAIHARIYGPTLVFEPKYRNLGWWQSERDWAAWDVDVPRRTKYRLYAIYACAPEVAGNRFLIQAGSQSLTGEVQSTGSWDQYAGRSLGEIELAAGRQEVIVRSDGPIRGALWDLQVIRLIPSGE